MHGPWCTCIIETFHDGPTNANPIVQFQIKFYADILVGEPEDLRTGGYLLVFIVSKLKLDITRASLDLKRTPVLKLSNFTESPLLSDLAPSETEKLRRLNSALGRRW